MVLCLSELGVRILCVDGRFRYLYIVFGGYLRILSAFSAVPTTPACTWWNRPEEDL